MDQHFLQIIAQFLKGIGWAFLPVLLLPAAALFMPKFKILTDVLNEAIAIIDGVNIWIGECAKWLLVIMVLSVATSVIALSIFGLSWTKLDEAGIYFHALTIFLGSAATLLAGEHVRVDIFYDRFSRRTKALIDFVGFYALLVPFCLIIIWGSQNYIGLAWSSLEGSAESDGIRGVFLLKTMVPVFAILLLLQGLALSGRAVFVIGGKEQPPLAKNMSAPFGEHDAKEGGL